MIANTSGPQPEGPDPFAFHSAGSQSPIAGHVSVDENGVSYKGKFESTNLAAADN